AEETEIRFPADQLFARRARFGKKAPALVPRQQGGRDREPALRRRRDVPPRARQAAPALGGGIGHRKLGPVFPQVDRRPSGDHLHHPWHRQARAHGRQRRRGLRRAARRGRAQEDGGLFRFVVRVRGEGEPPGDQEGVSHTAVQRPSICSISPRSFPPKDTISSTLSATAWRLPLEMMRVRPNSSIFSPAAASGYVHEAIHLLPITLTGEASFAPWASSSSSAACALARLVPEIISCCPASMTLAGSCAPSAGGSAVRGERYTPVALSSGPASSVSGSRSSPPILRC